MNTSKSILLTGGRAPVTLDLARLFAQSGHKVYVAESMYYHLCRYSKFVTKSFVVPAPIHDLEEFANALINIVKSIKIDVLIPTCEEIFAISSHYKKISNYCKLLCEPLIKIEPLHHKGKFIELCKNVGLNYPETTILKNRRDVTGAMKKWDKIVFKPVYSRFSREVIICNINEQDKIKNIKPIHNKYWVAQEFIVGKRLCSYSFARDGELLAHVNYPVDDCIGDIGASVAFRSINNPKIVSFVKKIIKHISFSGQIGFDFIEDKQGRIIPIECNPRATSGLHLFNSSDYLPDIMLGDNRRVILSSGHVAQLKIPLFWLSLFKKSPLKLINTITKGRDVIFSYKDILPGIISPLLIMYYLFQSWKAGMAVTEYTTFDIEWNGEL